MTPVRAGAPYRGGPGGESPGVDLRFDVEGVGIVRHAAAPTLRLDVVVDAGKRSVRSLSLDADLRIRARERAYDDGERNQLYELFGAPGEWGRSLRSIPWIRTSAVIPSFEGSRRFDLALPCTYDFDVAATKYLDGLDGGNVPLVLFFTGTVFSVGAGGRLQATRIPQDAEVRFEMETRVWRDLMEHYFPNTAWLRLRRDVFGRLLAFRSSEGLGTWERTLEALLEGRASRPHSGRR